MGLIYLSNKGLNLKYFISLCKLLTMFFCLILFNIIYIVIVNKKDGGLSIS